MVSITRATIHDYQPIVDIGRVSVEEAHRGSCPPEVLGEYMQKHYNEEAIKEELSNEANVYHIISYNGIFAGFSKIVLNTEHPNIQQKHVTKLDRIYLMKEFFGLKLGLELLNFNIAFSKRKGQTGIWLFTWVGNNRAIDFYMKTGFVVAGSHMFKVTDTHSNLNHQMFLDFTIE